MEKTKYSLSTIRKKKHMPQDIELRKDSSIIIMELFAEIVMVLRILVIMCGICQVAISFGEVVALITTMTILQRWKMSKNF